MEGRKGRRREKRGNKREKEMKEGWKPRAAEREGRQQREDVLTLPEQ